MDKTGPAENKTFKGYFYSVDQNFGIIPRRVIQNLK